jgi:hypothetical protein
MGTQAPAWILAISVAVIAFIQILIYLKAHT